MRINWAVLLLFLTGSGVLAQNPPRRANACVICHGDPDWVGEEGAQIVQVYAGDVHAEFGLSCQDCHGGDADPALADQPDASMNPRHPTRAFIGVPSPQEIPGFCGRCHSDADRMKLYSPGLRVDQEQEYWTSQHGRALRAGDGKVATCVSCHGTHGVLRAEDPQSPVYPTRVAETCRVCHSDPELMSGYVHSNGRPLGTNQYDLWRRSVHAQSMFEREDLSAPTCNDCHGNHGAAPPGLNSLVFVCGQCHGREASLFRESPKIEAWRQHDEYLMEAGSESCLACHEEDSPQSKMTYLRSFGECNVCHGNHGVIRPTVAMFAPLPENPCVFCHEDWGPLSTEVPEPSASEERYFAARDGLLASARGNGLEDSALFDWMVDRTLELPSHRLQGETGEGQGSLRPEFQELFHKFRIGKTAYEFEVEGSSEKTRLEVVRCTFCHNGEADESTGLLTGIDFLDHMHELTALTARAERILLAARRGGVETRPGFMMVNKAVDSQISLEVLIHSFQKDGAFADTHAEGIEFVTNALNAGSDAQSELQQRRFGLGVALIFILFFLVALGLKIRGLA